MDETVHDPQKRIEGIHVVVIVHMCTCTLVVVDAGIVYDAVVCSFQGLHKYRYM